MTRAIYLILCVCLHSGVLAQNVLKAYVANNLIPVNTIQPDSTDFSDLAGIGDAIGDARIVMLGEQEHGDGATMQAKTRLVKYLHEKKGFNVLAFESDFFSLNQGWDSLGKQEDRLKAFLQQNILPAWSACGQCDELLYAYVPRTHQTRSPLVMTGFDSNFSSAYSNYQITRFIDDYLRQQNIPYIHSPKYKPHFLAFVRYALATYVPKDKPDDLNRFGMGLDTVLHQLGDGQKDAFGRLVLENVKSSLRKGLAASDVVASVNIRDYQMAQNLRWLVQTKFPGEKVIVWAANAHIMKNTPAAFQYKQRPYQWMGTVFTGDSTLANQTYVIGFDSRRGLTKWASDQKASKVREAARNGFENWVDEKYPYAFIDFRRFRKANPGFNEYFVMKGQGHNNLPAVWTTVFDGVFYIRDMAPCTESRLKPVVYEKQ
jgi:erythromycin esterase-like protein